MEEIRGWEAIADKVGRFIAVRKVEENINLHRLVDNNIPYVEALRSSKWASNKEAEVNVVAPLMKGGLTYIDHKSNTLGKVLNKSLGGNIREYN
ncbi:hypothetical protein H5410_053825 [Solanum commersonii]|uniref:Uncharacterized protein n=1 Tax=Solanum commersonii TaxID=4109 RepID=A0A9J5X7G7_SOLCO|nr:hypothetical protein H5410_053825 [Solanum commersonii]